MKKLLFVLFLCSLTSNAGGTKVLTGAIDLFTRELIIIPSHELAGEPPKVMRTCQSFKE